MAKEDVRRLDLNLILVFDALLKYRHVTRAAASLHVGQSAVSHSLRRLRLFFDDPLFARSVSGVAPTAQALELSATVSEIAALVRSGLLSQAAFRPEAASRTLTLCCTDLGEFGLLSTLIAALAEASPGSVLRTVQAQPSEVREMLESGDADLAIGALPPGQGEIYGQKLYTQGNIVIVNRKTVRGDAIDLDFYCAAPHVAISPIRGRPTIIDEALARMGRQRRIVLTTEHHLILPYILTQSPALIATAPEMMREACRMHRGLRVLPAPVELPDYDVFQYWHSRFHHDRFHGWFRNLVAHFFQNHPMRSFAESADHEQ